MKFFKLNSSKRVEVNIQKYRVLWNSPCRSKFQFELKQWFRQYWEGHICLEEFRIPGSLLRCDLVNLTKRIIVEINGAQHDAYNKHFHAGTRANFLKQIKRDQMKRDWAQANKFSIVEIEPRDVPLSLSFFEERYNLSVI